MTAQCPVFRPGRAVSGDVVLTLRIGWTGGKGYCQFIEHVYDDLAGMIIDHEVVWDLTPGSYHHIRKPDPVGNLLRQKISGDPPPKVVQHDICRTIPQSSGRWPPTKPVHV